MVKDVTYPKQLFHGIRPLVGGFPKMESLRIFGGDTETCHGDALTIQMEGPEGLEDALFCYTDNDNIFRDFWCWLKPRLRLKGVNIVYIHNLNFDLRVLFAKYRRQMYEMRSDIAFDIELGGDLIKVQMIFGKVNKASLKCGKLSVSIFCSRLFTQASLMRSLKMLKIPYEKLGSPEGLGTIRYNSLPSDSSIRLDFERYARMDATAERALGGRIMDFHIKYNVRPSLSLPSFASRVFRRHFMKPGDSIPFPPLEVVKAAEKSYHGGKNGYYFESPRIVEDAYEVDINSAYPYAMALLGGVTDGQYMRTTEYKPDHLGIYCLTGRFLTRPDKSSYAKKAFPVIFDHRFNPITSGAFSELWHTGFETEHILRRTDLEITDLWGYFWAPSGKAFNPFKAYVDHFYGLKQSTPKSDPNYHFYKIMLNALYGKLVSTIELISEESSDENALLRSRGCDIPSNIRIDSRFDPVLGRFISMQKQWRAGALYNPFLASQITGHTRAYLYELECKTSAFHSATDSVKAKTLVPATPELGGVKAECFGRCYVFRNKLYLHFSKGFEYCHHNPEDLPYKYPMLMRDRTPHPRAGQPLKDYDGQHLCKVALHGYKGDLWRLFDARNQLIERGYMDYTYNHVVGLREGMKRALTDPRFKVCDFIDIHETLDLRSEPPEDLIAFIKRMGGIDILKGGGDFQRFIRKESLIRGLAREGRGLSPDNMRESVSEAGYPLPEASSINDLWTLLDSAVLGQKIYTMEHMGYEQENYDQEEFSDQGGVPDSDSVPF